MVRSYSQITPLRPEHLSKGIIDVATTFIDATQQCCGKSGLSIMEYKTKRDFSPIFGLSLETQFEKNAILLIDHAFLYWCCLHLGGGALIPKLKVTGKGITVTEQILLEEIGRYACESTVNVSADSQLSFSGCGIFPEPWDSRMFPDLSLFSSVTSDGFKFGKFAVGMQFGKLNSLPNFILNFTANDCSTFAVTDSTGLWDIARGRISALSTEWLRYWIHQEHPQVGVVIAELAGAERVAEIFQHKDSDQDLFKEILIRIYYTQNESSLLAKALASQALIYLEDFTHEVFRNLKHPYKGKTLHDIEKRRPDFARILREKMAKPKLRKIG